MARAGCMGICSLMTFWWAAGATFYLRIQETCKQFCLSFCCVLWPELSPREILLASDVLTNQTFTVYVRQSEHCNFFWKKKNYYHSTEVFPMSSFKSYLRLLTFSHVFIRHNYIFNKISKKSRILFEMYYESQITFFLQFLEFLKFYGFFLTWNIKVWRARVPRVPFRLLYYFTLLCTF